MATRRDELRRQWTELAPAWIKEAREGRNPTRNGLLDPLRSASGGWCRDAKGVKQHVILDNYFDEGERYWEMMGVRFTNFHRTLSTYIRSFIEVGFLLEGIVEPTVCAEQLAEYPELDDELRVPNFIIYKLRKP